MGVSWSPSSSSVYYDILCVVYCVWMGAWWPCHPLRETPYLPSAYDFAECISSDTRQTIHLPSLKYNTLGKVKTLGKVHSLPSVFFTLGKVHRWRVYSFTLGKPLILPSVLRWHSANQKKIASSILQFFFYFPHTLSDTLC